MTITKRDIAYLNAAKLMAENSNYDRFHLGCVLVYKNTIIGKGCNGNKTHPIQKRYNRKYRHFRDCNHYIHDSIHAEIAAIISVDSSFTDWDKVKAYIYRIAPGKDSGYGMARPCPACFNAFKDLGLKHIYYTTNEGICYERIED